MDKKKTLYDGNSAFYAMFNLQTPNIGLEDFIEQQLGQGAEHTALWSFITAADHRNFELMLENDKAYKITKSLQGNGHTLLYFSDMTEIAKNRLLLSQHNTALNDANRRLISMADNTKALAIAKTKAQMAQSVHDILGHSLTVVIGTAELAANDNISAAKGKLAQIEELLVGSLNDIKNAFTGDNSMWGQTSLTKAIEHLKNESIHVEFATHGNTYELNSSQTEAVFRLCQEAVTNSIKHGRAETIYIILRYRPGHLEVFAIDNGAGCGNITKSYGLRGIEERLTELSGSVDFNSDGENGFTIHAVLPI